MRTAGSDGYKLYLWEPGRRANRTQRVDSVESLVLETPASLTATNLARIRHADLLFIAGGDQATCINLWDNTAVETAVEALAAQNVPTGGTSAGLAVLGAVDYSAEAGSFASHKVLTRTVSRRPRRGRQQRCFGWRAAPTVGRPIDGSD